MISLRKYINFNDTDSTADTPERSRTGAILTANDVLSAYRASLTAMGCNGQRAIPSLGDALTTAFAGISEGLSRVASAESIDRARVEVEEHLVVWSDRAQARQKENERAVKELLIAVAGAAESTGLRDEKFALAIAELSERLRAVAGLDSLPLIRRSIVENASALNICVARMADEGKQSIHRLTCEIAEYQARLQASERRAMIDPLTGLCNRRGFEQQLDFRIATHRQFSLLIADLDGFKTINDRHGHLVGDEILRQFATEFSSQFLSEDTVARWGGDEFVALVTGTGSEMGVRADRVRHWVLGEYKVTIDGVTTSVMVNSALGMAAWDEIEGGLELFERADKDLYRKKNSARMARV